MKYTFNSEFFGGNRQKLLDETGAGLIVLSANGLLQRSADTTFTFRQESNFWYLTGVEEPDFTLVISKDDVYLIEPRRSEHRDLWDGAIEKESIKSISGISEIFEHYSGWNKLDKQIKKAKKIHTIAPAEAYFEHFGFYANPARAALLSQLQKHKNAQLVDIRKTIARMRQVKQQPEIDAISNAIGVTSKSLSKIKNKITSYSHEHKIVADITRDFIKSGCKGHAYSPIVAYGKNAATIHYVDINSKIGEKGLILMDVGAEFANYSADITRTYAVSEPSKREKQVYRSVKTTKEFANSLLKPGIKMRELEKQVDEFMGKELKKLGLINAQDDKKGIKRYYPHLVSHHLGLDTHDAADYNKPLEPGMIVTIEPGIYIADESIGIRLEDDMLITEGGSDNLSGSLSLGLT